jgi:carbonic anhydrase
LRSGHQFGHLRSTISTYFLNGQNPMKRILMMAATATAWSLSPVQAADHAPHWAYQGEMDPAHWGKEFPTCGIGKAQSPINIKGPFATDTHDIKPDYKEGALKIVNNGHTIQVDVDPGSKLIIDNESFDLLQFHFHRPSEEKVNGKPMAMVAHFVHKNQAGKLVVLAVFLAEGAENATLKTIWANAPRSEAPEIVVPNAKINPAALIPPSLGHYSYEGSLTTPPCTEGVTFYVLKTPTALSKAQVQAFPFKVNARPVQPLNGRKIFAN